MRKIILTILFLASVNFIDAQSWSPVGPGIGSNYYNSVRSLATYNGELYAGGNFNTAGNVAANNIAKWDGSHWSPLTSGINGDVQALCVYNGELYAAGNFSAAGNIAANNIAKWDGNTWSAVGPPDCYSIKSLEVYNGELYAAGFFIFPNFPDGISIAKWDGNSWAPTASETVPYFASIECMEVYNDELYAAGAYYLIGGGGVAEFYSVSKWNGINWSNILTIPATFTLDGALGDILSMKVYNGELYIAGNFGGVDTITTSQIAKWNGINWSAVGTGINFGSYPYGIDGSLYTFVKSLEVYNGALYATGWFTHCGTIQTLSIAKWDGNNWSHLGLGLNGYGYTMTGTDTALFVGGSFTSVNGYNGVYATNIAAWKAPCTAAPLQPEIIHGNTSVCAGTQQTFFVNEIPGNANYTWTLPSGWAGNSTTNSITVVTGDTSGTISVTANNSCGNSIVQTLDVLILPATAPIIQSNITGSNSPCEGSTQTYSIAAVSNATDYTWNFPSGWTGSSNDTSITLIAGHSAGVIAVRANNNCGSSITKVLPVTVATTPVKPDLIQGKQIVCIGTANLYHVPSSQPATNYSWLLPPGWAGNSVTDSITIIAGNSNGAISVSAYNSCGSSDYTTLTVSADSIFSQPGNIIGNIYATTNEFNYYFITPVASAISYNWSSIEAIIHGQNTSFIAAQWKNAGTYELSVQSIYRCGSSERKKITVEVSDFTTDNPFDLQILPNPSNGDFYLKAKRIQDKMIKVEIYTASGQIICNSGSKPGSNDYTQFFDLKKMAQGIYIVKIIIDNKVYSRKILKNK